MYSHSVKVGRLHLPALMYGILQGLIIRVTVSMQDAFNFYRPVFKAQCSRWRSEFFFLFLNAHASTCMGQCFFLLSVFNGTWASLSADKG
jgi:hypothetical protein